MPSGGNQHQTPPDSMVFHRIPKISICFPWISVEFHAFSYDFLDFHRIPRISTGCFKFPENSMNERRSWDRAPQLGQTPRAAETSPVKLEVSNFTTDAVFTLFLFVAHANQRTKLEELHISAKLQEQRSTANTSASILIQSFRSTHPLGASIRSIPR